jgi:hypothetical protein
VGLERLKKRLGDALPARLVRHQHVGDLVPREGEAFGVHDAPLPLMGPSDTLQALTQAGAGRRSAASVPDVAVALDLGVVAG